MLVVLRKAQGKRSLRQFAKKLGVSVAYLSDIFHGRRQGGTDLFRKLGYTKIVTTTVDYRKIR
jgi:transcriptional regulator with XRE-family HTH domain